jgi:hypothetical protein
MFVTYVFILQECRICAGFFRTKISTFGKYLLVEGLSPDS